jgi:hypothetical protein
MPMLRSMRLVALFGGVATLFLLIAVPANAAHIRPKSAPSVRVSFVPAYSPCTAPNRTHGPPLAFASCAPPAQTSGQATVGTPDAFGGAANFGGSVRLVAAPTTPGPPNEADIYVTMPMSDVRCVPTGARCGTANASGPADYSGEIRLTFGTRITDHWNATVPGGGTDAATVVDISIELAWPIACAETASTSTGSTCNVNTSVNSFIPGAVREGRAVWEIGAVQVDDGGADGDSETTEDNAVFVRQGIFIP